MKKLALITTSAIALGLALAPQAFAAAADSAPADKKDVTQLPELVITAQKRTERLETVPVAASVVSNTVLAKENATDISDLNNLVPSVQLNGTINGRVPLAMRGISTDSNEGAVGVPSGVALMLDGVPIPSDAYAANQLSDVQSVEVLKGPQGTLGGRTAAAGVINIVTRGPSADFKGSVSATVTNDNEQRVSAFVSGPINDQLQFSLAGWGDHVTYPITNIYYDKKTYQIADGGRFKLRWQPTNDLDITLMERWSETNSYGFNFVYTYVTPGATLLFNPGPLNQALLLPGITPSMTNQSYNSPVNSISSKVRDQETSLNINYKLGDNTLSSTFSFMDEKQRNSQDLFDVAAYFWNVLTAGHAPPYDNTQTQWEDVRQFTEELKLVSPAGQKLSYVVGAFFSDTTVAEHIYRNLIPAAEDVYVTPDTATYDLYGRATWKVLPATTIVAGLRYNYDVISYKDNQQEFAPASPFPSGSNPYYSTGSVSTSTLVGDFTVQQQLAPNSMVYATYARGYSPEVYNTAIALVSDASLKPVAAEEVDDIEIGSKGTYFNRRLEVNLAVFDTNYYNYQIQVYRQLPGYVNPPLVLENGGARTMGAELDTTWQATHNLRLNFNAAYIDAKFTSYHKAPCYGFTTVPIPPAAPAVPSTCTVDPATSQVVQDVTGKTMPNSPKLKFVVGFDQRIPLDNLPFDLGLGGTYSYRTKAQMLADQNPQAIQGAFGILNLNASATTHDKKYSLTFFANNVLNQHYLVDVEDFWTGPWSGFNTVVGQPARDSNRYFGLRLNADF